MTVSRTGFNNRYCTVFYNFSLNWLTKGEDNVVSIPDIYATDNVNNNLEIYPNPASDYLNVNTNDLTIINIYNVEGQLLKSYNSDEDMMIIDVSDFEQGIYVIEGLDDNRRVKGNIVIVK